MINLLTSNLSDSVNPRDKEYFQIHINRFEQIIFEVNKLHLNKDSKILDVGCYPLILFNFLNTFYKVYGISTFGCLKNQKNIHQLNIETTPLPFPDNTFDLVLLTEVIEHLTNPQFALSEIARVLKANSFLIITTPNIVRSQNLIKLLIGKNIFFDLNQMLQTSFQDHTIYHRHNREYTLDELKKLLLFQKFKPKYNYYFISFSPFRLKNKNDNLFIWIIKLINFIYMKLLPWRRDTIFFLATNSSKKQ